MAKHPNPSDPSSAPHWYSGPRLWATLKKVAHITGRKTVYSALLLFYCLKDEDTPIWAKGVIAGALGYLILPVDLIPDMIPGIGYSDDWGVIFAALGAVAVYVKSEHKSKAKALTERLFGLVIPQQPSEFNE